MKIQWLLLISFLLLRVAVHAQMKIGDNSTSINNASLLELETTNKGVVLPRVSLTNITTPSPLPAGLLTGTVVFNTNASTTNGNGIGLYYWNGTSWSPVTPNISSSAWSITGNANTNYAVNFLGTTNNVSLRFRTSNVQRVIIDSLGRVGIATNSPSEKLDVSGNIRLSGALMPNNNAGTSGFFLMSSGPNNPPLWFDAANYAWQLDGNPLTSIRKFGSTTNYDIPFVTNNIERMRLTATGFLGIGLTNPLYALSVSAASNPLYLSGVQATATFNTDSVLTINGGVVKKAPYSSLAAGNWSLTGNTGTSATTNFIGTTDAMDFVTKTNNMERMRITGSGLVGIGTSTPSSDLTLYQSSGSGNSKGFTFAGNSIGGTSSGSGFLMSLGYNTTGNKQLWIGDADYAGNASGSFARFGIAGASFPVLDAVSGNNALRRYLAIGVAGDANSGIIFGGDNTSVNPGSQVWDNGNMTIGSGYKSYAAPSNGLLVQGNVGINTSNPGSTLDVKGTLRLSGSSSGYVGLAPAADAGSTSYTLPSADGAAGQALITNGSGNLSWASAAATIGNIGTGATIQGTATGKYYCTGSYITLPPGKFIVNVYMMLSSSPSPMTQTTANQPGSFFIKSFFADASLGTVAGATVSPPLPQSYVSPDVVGNGKLISGSINVGQTYNPISGFVVINNTSGANKSYYYWAGWVSLTNVASSNSLPAIGGTNYGEDNIVAYPSN